MLLRASSVEVPNAIRKAAIEELSTYLKENGNILLHLMSCTHQNPSPLGRDRRRLAEYEEKRGKQRCDGISYGNLSGSS